MGNADKTKICLNLVKSFCGNGSQFKEIENQVNGIQAIPSTVKIEGAFEYGIACVNPTSIGFSFHFQYRP